MFEGSLNLSPLAGDVGLLSGNLFASLESTAIVAEPLAPTPQAKQADFLQAADIKVREPDHLPLDLSSPLAVRPAASETLQAL